MKSVKRLLVVVWAGFMMNGLGAEDLLVSGESESNGLNVIISAPAGFSDRVEVYSCSDLTSNNWRIVTQNLRPSGSGSALWFTDANDQSGFFVAGNMDVDSDGDGLPDAREKYVHKTRSDSADSDDDGMTDGWEIQHGFDSSGDGHQTEALEDADGDGLLNIEELQTGTNPQDNDTDGDGFQDAFDYRMLTVDYPIFGEGIFYPVSTKTVHSTVSVATKLTTTWGDSFWYPYPKDSPSVNAGSASATPRLVSNGFLEWRRWDDWTSETGDALSPLMEGILSAAANGIYRNLTHEHQIETEIGYDIYMARTLGYVNQIDSWVITNAMCLVMSTEYESTTSYRAVTDGPRARDYEDICAYSDGGDSRSEVFKFVFNRPVTNRTVKWLTYQFDYYENERYGYEVHSCTVNGLESDEFNLTSGDVTIPVLELNGDFNLDQTVDTTDTILRAQSNAVLPLSVSPEVSDTPSNVVAFTLDFPMQYTMPSGGLTLSLNGVESGERFRVWSEEAEPLIRPMMIGGGDDPELIIDPPLLFDTDEATEYWWPISDRYEYTEFPKTLYIECLACGATNDKLAELRVASEYNGEELCSARLPIKAMQINLIPDYDRNGIINSNDQQKLWAGENFYFWINDDDDFGFDDDSKAGKMDIPGAVSGWLEFDGRTPDCDDLSIDGERDMVDFFPVFLDLKDIIDFLGINNFRYVLKHTDSAVNAFIDTNLTATNAGAYLWNYPYVSSNSMATLYPITEEGYELPATFLSAVSNETGGVILLEGKSISTNGLLVLEVLDTNGTLVASGNLPLRMDIVENMFFHKNLRSASGGSGGEDDRSGAPNWPDSLCNGKNFVFVHGYNVNEQAARGWQAEFFKRMYWSGNNARFHAITWHGDESQIWTWWSLGYYGYKCPDYHGNVLNARQTAPALYDYLDGLSDSTVIAAHSLGNMLTSCSLLENPDVVSKYFMLNAAVASEAYDPAMRNENMLHVNWLDYEASTNLYASEWHMLFGSGDRRQDLTWQGRFSSIAHKCINLYSSGDQVFDEHLKTSVPGVFEVLPHIKSGRFSWAIQEKRKGEGSFNGGSSETCSSCAGWSLNGAYSGYTAAQAAAIPLTNLITEPFFGKGSGDFENSLFQTNSAVANAWLTETNEWCAIAGTIPAASLAAGRTPFLENEILNIDVNKIPDNDGLKPLYWPDRDDDPVDENYSWLHSDIKNMAYVYTVNVFKRMVLEGGLDDE